MNCCNHQCNEGRDCPHRIALQLHRLQPESIESSEAATERSDWIGRIALVAAGAAAALLTAATVFHH